MTDYFGMGGINPGTLYRYETGHNRNVVLSAIGGYSGNGAGGVETIAEKEAIRVAAFVPLFIGDVPLEVFHVAGVGYVAKPFDGKIDPEQLARKRGIPVGYNFYEIHGGGD